MIKKIFPSLMAATVAGLSSIPLQAINLKNGDTELGEFTGQVQAHYVVDGKDNGYDPNDGASYLIKLKYVSPSFSGFKVGVASYTNGHLSYN
jgi:hypothetical protein